jgi:acetate kinase
VSLILTINGGSSSLKFALFTWDPGKFRRIIAGNFERIGLVGTRVSIRGESQQREERELDVKDHAACVPVLLDLLQQRASVRRIDAIGHRVVHGGPRYSRPQRVDDEMIAELQRISPFDPEHLPAEIALMQSFGTHFRDVPQIACFDTAFHRDMPRVASMLPIPRRYEKRGVRKYGFHGLSCSWLMQELERIDPAGAKGRIILAHLGNGASMTAVHNGRSIDTTMSFTPAAGLVMSSRTGDLDPGLIAYFSRAENMTAEDFTDMVNSKSGLLGISETSSDIRDLLAREKTDARAAEALAIFCYNAKKHLAALAAALGGLDTLVFSAGIGENSSEIRARICAGLDFFGIELDVEANRQNTPIISSNKSKVTVRIIRTDEELFIVQIVSDFLNAKEEL